MDRAADGSISVWASHLQSLEDVRDANFRHGESQFAGPKKGRRTAPRPAWFGLENGQLAWFRHEFDTKVWGIIDVAAQVQQIELQALAEEADQIVLLLNDQTALHLSSAAHAKNELREWYR